MKSLEEIISTEENIEEIIFMDSKIKPDNKLLEITLGKKYNLYFDLYKKLIVLNFIFEWKYYNDRKAWMCKILFKSKYIALLSIWNSGTKLTFSFSEESKDWILNLNISDVIINKMSLLKNKYSLEIIIENKNILNDVIKLIYLKIGYIAINNILLIIEKHFPTETDSSLSKRACVDIELFKIYKKNKMAPFKEMQKLLLSFFENYDLFLYFIEDEISIKILETKFHPLGGKDWCIWLKNLMNSKPYLKGEPFIYFLQINNLHSTEKNIYYKKSKNSDILFDEENMGYDD